MRPSMITTVLARVYGFAEPTPSRDGTVVYECAYCGARNAAPAPDAPHAAVCQYWGIAPMFEHPVAARRVGQLLGTAHGSGGAGPTAAPVPLPDHFGERI